MGARGWIIFAIISVLALGGLIFMSTQNRIDVSEFDANSIIEAHEKNGSIGDRVYGSQDPVVVLFEYGDYQCPGCAGAYGRVKTVIDRYSDHVALVYRNLPLTQIHPNALAAAAAAEAAGQQGKFWEMHGLLYQNQSAWAQLSSSERSDAFRLLADQAGINLEQYKEDITSDAIDRKIRFDQAMFRTLERDPSTPTFVLDGEVVPNETHSDEATLDAFIRQKLIDAGVELPESEE